MTVRAVIFDWGRTLYDPETGAFFPETAPVIAYLEQMYRLAIVSLITQGDYASQVARRHAILRDGGLSASFSPVLFASDDKDGLYEQVLIDLGLRATDVAIVDDRVERGIRWGNRHGATTIWLRRGKFQHEGPTSDTGAPTYIIGALATLLDIL